MNATDGNGALREGWARTTLGALGVYLNGRAFKSTEWSRTGRQIIRIQDLTGSTHNPNYYQGEADERHVVRTGDFLISWSATLGAYIWTGPEAVLNQHIFKVLSAIDQQFHYHLVRNEIADLERRAHGSGVVHVTKGVFDSTAVELPPLPEQRRIAVRLDEIEMASTTVLAHLASARSIVQRFRTAVLAAACTGRLTADWRENHPEATSEALLNRLIEMHLPATRRRSGTVNGHGLTSEAQLALLPDTWSLVRLGEIIDVGTGATPLRNNRAYYKDGTIRWVTSGAVNAGIIRTPTELITPRAVAETNVKLFPAGTLLVAMYGEGQTRGRVAELAIEAGTNQAVAAVLFDAETAPLQPFVRLFFEDSYQRVRALSIGGVQPNLNLGMIKATSIPLPPLDEQHEIVRRTDTMLATAERLTTQIEHVESTLERVGRGSLAKAFRGDLVPTEAALAEQAGRDFESAGELLARMQSATSATPHRRRKVAD